MKFTITCLTIITIVSLLMEAGEIGLTLWILYGFYKLVTEH